MRVAVLYLRVLAKAEPGLPMLFPYDIGHTRFLSSYKRFRPTIPHDLIVVNCGKHDEFSDFDDVVFAYAYYDGLGSDCGTYQAVASVLDYDFVLCCNTLAYFWRHNWLEPIVKAFEKHGKGIYGVTGSYEHHPHLRTPCIGVSPEVLRAYPHKIDTRQKCIGFESGEDNLTLWAERCHYPTLLVTAESGVLGHNDWRKPANIFRRGNQSNCLVWDRHTLVYAEADADTKKALEHAADGT
jgi:hypothetical protein